MTCYDVLAWTGIPGDFGKTTGPGVSNRWRLSNIQDDDIRCVLSPPAESLVPVQDRPGPTTVIRNQCMQYVWQGIMSDPIKVLDPRTVSYNPLGPGDEALLWLEPGLDPIRVDAIKVWDWPEGGPPSCGGFVGG